MHTSLRSVAVTMHAFDAIKTVIIHYYILYIMRDELMHSTPIIDVLDLLLTTILECIKMQTC